MRKLWMLVGVALLLVGAIPQGASAHGYVKSPMSRAAWCQEGQVSGCGPVQWEPQSVEGPKGFPQAGPPDGHICAGGNERFAQLDDPSLNWPLTSVTPGQDVRAHWHLTASHKTTDWSYYITKDGWDAGQPLTREALEPTPFHVELSNGTTYPPTETYHTITLPSNKHDRHLIVGVWEIADTPNAFYQCSDVLFS